MPMRRGASCAPLRLMIVSSMVALGMCFTQKAVVNRFPVATPAVHHARPRCIQALEEAPERGHPLVREAALNPDEVACIEDSCVVAPSLDSFPPGAAPVLVLCCAIASVCALDRVVMSVCILPMAAQFGFTDAEKGLIAAAFSLGYCLGLLPAGTAASTASPKAVLLGGVLVWSAAQAASPAAAALGIGPLLACRAVMGIGEAAAVPSIQAVAANFVPARRRSAYWGVLAASLSAGTICSYVIAPPLIESRGWEFVFVAFGGAGALLAALWAQRGASAPSALTPLATQPSADPQAPHTIEAPRAIPWAELAASRPVWALTASHAAHNFFMYFGLAWLPTYFNYQFSLDMKGASGAALLPFLAGGVGSLVAGTACDALVSSGMPLTRARKLMQAIGCGAPALAMLALFALGEGVGGTSLTRDVAEGLFVLSIGGAAASGAGFGCGAQDISTRLSSLIYGGSSVVGVVAGASSQYLTGWLLEQNGRDFSPLFGIMTGVELLGLVLFCMWWSSEPAFE